MLYTIFDEYPNKFDKKLTLQQDKRAVAQKTLNGETVSFSPDDLNEWKKHRAELIERIKFSTAIDLCRHDYPMNARVFDAVAYEEGFVCEKVIFESFPDFYVTGSLYRPCDIGEGQKYPAILNPHGHWTNGRFEQSELCDIPLRCANFALRGMVAFAYDMIGYGDSCQIGHEYISDRQNLWNMNGFSLQCWNSIKALDFICSLPYVDPEKIGCTGASGGGTQTFFLTALDERVKACAPINMVSSYMQGGCSCENSPYLRIGCNNVDYAAVAAPRPMFLSGCDGDWTAKSCEVEFPAIRKIYALYGAEDQLETYYQSSPHCYDRRIRQRVYRFFCRAFEIADRYESEGLYEAPVKFGGIEKLRIAPDLITNEKIRSGADLFKIQKNIICANKALLDEETRQRKIYTMLGLEKALYRNPRCEKVDRCDLYGFACTVYELSEADTHVLYYSLESNSPNLEKTGTVLVFTENREMIRSYLESSYRVLIGRLYKSGESMKANLYGINYYYTYNYCDNAYRSWDMLNLIRYLQERGEIDGIYADSAYAALCELILPFLPQEIADKTVLCTAGEADEEYYLNNLYIPAIMTV